MNIREAQFPADWAGVMAVEVACFPPGDLQGGFSREDYEAILGTGGRCWVAEADGQVVGCLWLERLCPSSLGDDADGAYLTSLGVLPGHRRSGAGDRLLACAIRAAREMEPRHFALHVSPAAVPALRLYLQAGFQPEAWEVDYYAPGEGALYLQLEL